MAEMAAQTSGEIGGGSTVYGGEGLMERVLATTAVASEAQTVARVSWTPFGLSQRSAELNPNKGVGEMEACWNFQLGLQFLKNSLNPGSCTSD